MKELIERLGENPLSESSEEEALRQVENIIKNAREKAEEMVDHFENELADAEFIRDKLRRWRKLSDVNWRALKVSEVVTPRQAKFGEKVQGDYDFDL